MPALFIFLFKVNIALLLFCAGYYLVLRHLTFYTINRVYLLAAILFASIYPEINLSGFVQQHQQLAKPAQQIVLIWQAPARVITQPPGKPDYWQWAGVVFWLGVLVLIIRLAMQLFSLFGIYRSSRPEFINDHLVRVTDKDAPPFSFWQSIFVNPQKHSTADLKAIILHEQIHVDQWHTADILLAELSCIFYWFNPGIWFIKRAIRENVEFITDQKILKKGIDTKSYQYSLINVSFNNTSHSIVNHFNIKTIKTRIIMMNKERSSRFNLTRYAFTVPAVIALSLVFTISKADFAKPIKVNIINAIMPLAKVTHANVAANGISQTNNLPGNKVFITSSATTPININKVTSITAKSVKNSLQQYHFIQAADIPALKNYGNYALTYSKVPGDSTNSLQLGFDTTIKKIKLNGKISSRDSLLHGSSKSFVQAHQLYTRVSEIHQAETRQKIDTSKFKVIVMDSDPPSYPDTHFGVVLPKSVDMNDYKSSASISLSSNSKPDTVKKAQGVWVASNSTKKLPLFIIDGKEASLAELKKLDLNDVDAIVVSQEKDTDKTLYGKKAKNGVVRITTKKDKE